MIFQFKIQLQDISKPPVWRRVLVPAETSFAMFHHIIQEAMGWYNVHMYSFSPKGYGSIPWIEKEADDNDKLSFGDRNKKKTPASASTLKISDVFKTKGQTFTYIYDFGDDWKHKITLEEIDKKNISPLPKLIAGKGTCPPEDCGGPGGYAHFKEVVADKNHPQYQDMKEWLYPGDEEDLFDEDEAIWDADEFDLEIEKEMFDEFIEIIFKKNPVRLK